jgi:Putative auto-transporter adhesin, head GIN domain
MKRPIQNSQFLFYGSIFAVFAFMIAVNLVFTENKSNISSRPAVDILPLKLANKTLVKRQVVPAFKGIKIGAQFLDTIIFEPSNRPHLEIKGDLNLVNNLGIYHTTNNELIIQRKSAFWVDSLRDPSYYDYVFTGVLDKGGLSMKIYYTELENISIYGEAKLIVQKGTLRGSRIQIEACAEKAQFNVNAKNLELSLSKPQFWVDSLGRTIPPPTSVRNGFQTITGKADLVQINPQYSSSWVDVSKLKCRHVHCVLRAGGGSKKIIAAPSQLLSYFGSQPLPLPEVEVICKSKAKVSYAYEDAMTRRTIRMK